MHNWWSLWRVQPSPSTTTLSNTAIWHDALANQMWGCFMCIWWRAEWDRTSYFIRWLVSSLPQVTGGGVLSMLWIGWTQLPSLVCLVEPQQQTPRLLLARRGLSTAPAWILLPLMRKVREGRRGEGRVRRKIEGRGGGGGQMGGEGKR